MGVDNFVDNLMTSFHNFHLITPMFFIRFSLNTHVQMILKLV